MSVNTERLTAERLAFLRKRVLAGGTIPDGYQRELLTELDAVTRERDEAVEKLEGTRRWLSRVEGELRRYEAEAPR